MSSAGKIVSIRKPYGSKLVPVYCLSTGKLIKDKINRFWHKKHCDCLTKTKTYEEERNDINYQLQKMKEEEELTKALSSLLLDMQNFVRRLQSRVRSFPKWTDKKKEEYFNNLYESDCELAEAIKKFCSSKC